MLDETDAVRFPRVVQPGETALMLPDEFEQRMAGLDREMSASASAERSLQGGADPGDENILQRSVRNPPKP